MKKRGNITRRTLISVFFTVVILIVSISVSTGFQLRNVLIEKYSAFALTYVKAAAEFIDGDKVGEYYSTGQKDAYYEEISKYLNATADSSAEDANIEYFYILIPGEEEFIYIWDAEPDEEPMDLLDTYPYSEGAKEQAEKIFNKEITEDAQYYVDAENGTPTLTVSVPLLDSADNVVAIIAADLSVRGINSALGSILIGVLIPVAGIMLLTMVLYYYVTKKGIIQPIIKLQKATEEIVENLESEKTPTIDIHTNDEIELLADSFVDMTGKLREYISQNAAITAEKERIGAELELATRIQADMLPNIFPAFPDRDDFDVYAMMTPAKEVGGDFYDFFLVDDTRLAMVVADVSGKGVPAALFMMMCKILIQNQVMSGKSPAEALEAVNNQICSNNREEMFITVWLGVLDLETGLLTASNAGHEKPMLLMPGGEFEMYKDRHGFVIGGMEGVKYKEYQIQLERGAKLFTYTDGVPEATSENDELFGTDRTLAALNSVKDCAPDVILHKTKEAVDSFVGNAPQFDDLTMLCIEYIGKQPEEDAQEDKNEITIDNEVNEISKVIDYVAALVEKLPFSMKVQNQIEVAVDEIMSNIVHYAYGDRKGKATVRVESDEKGITLTVTDSGIPYDPLKKEDPDITLSAEERGIGGYGIFIVKKVMDELHYQHVNGKNILTMRKNFTK
ncbi:MAG: SpoIIE family protein phosphatase [Clostridia bacterium]|nr:SpoIIE family protein phosphatase [Clostridia bacterium]